MKILLKGLKKKKVKIFQDRRDNISFGINTTTPEGIVVAADSRQSYHNWKGIARIGSNNASKFFQLNDRIGVVVTGLAFLPEDGIMKSVTKFIEQFKRGTDLEKLSIKNVLDIRRKVKFSKYLI